VVLWMLTLYRLTSKFCLHLQVKKESANSSETSVHINETCCHNPHDHTVDKQHSEYVKYFICLSFNGAVFKTCALLGYNAALSGSPVPTFRDNLSVPSSRVKKSKKTLEDEIYTLSRNVATGPPFNAALYRRRAKVPCTWRRKPETTLSLLRIYSVQMA
jgi:hypothetical protein